jgi:hypothetical protein
VARVSSIGVKVDAGYFVVRASGVDGPTLYVNGSAVVVSAGEGVNAGGTIVRREGRWGLLSADPDQNPNESPFVLTLQSKRLEKVEIRAYTDGEERYLSVVVEISSGFYNVQGLLGVADSNSTNDLMLRTGVIVGSGTTPSVQLVEALAESWKVTEAESVFFYETGEGPRTYDRDDFVAAYKGECATYDSHFYARESCLMYGLVGLDYEMCLSDACLVGKPMIAELVESGLFSLSSSRVLSYESTARMVTNTYLFGGREYAVMDNTPPDSEAIGCQTTPLLLPTDWTVAPNRAIARAVVTLGKWGTNCVVLKDGMSVSPDAVDCGTLDIERLHERGQYARPRSCNRRVLISRYDGSLGDLISNPSFEENDGSWVGMGTAGFTYVNASSARTGQREACITVSQAPEVYGGLYQEVHLDQVDPIPFHIGVWSRAAGVEPPFAHNYWVPSYSLVVEAYDEDGVLVFNDSREFELETHEYFYHGMDVAAGVPIALLRVSLQMKHLNGTVCFDDVQTGPPNGNILLNPSLYHVIPGEWFLLNITRTDPNLGEYRIVELLFDDYPFAKYWEGLGRGKGTYQVSGDHIFPSQVGPGRAYSALINATDVTQEYGIKQRIVLNDLRGDGLTFYVGGYSKSVEMSGISDADYALYVDMEYADGTASNGHFVSFSTGTHDWEYRNMLIPATKAVKALTFLGIVRKRTGAAWFGEFSVIPIVRSQGTLSTVRGAFGDPHIATLDGVVYDFAHIGEFVLYEDTGMSVQVRSAAINKGTVNVGAAVHFKGTAPVVAQLLCKNGTAPPSLKVNGNSVYFADSNMYAFGTEGGDVSVSGVLGDANDPLVYRVRSGQTGHVVTLKVFRASIAPQMQYLQVFIETPRSYRFNVRGLLGNWNNNATDDEETILDKEVGTVTAAGVSMPSDYVDVFPALLSIANVYRVTESTSLFMYEPGESTETFRDDLFVGGELSDYSQAQIDEAASICRKEKLEKAVFSSCLRDVLFSGDKALALGYFGLQSSMGFTTLLVNESIAVPSPEEPNPTPTPTPTPEPDATSPLPAWVLAIIVVASAAVVVGSVITGRIAQKRRHRKFRQVTPDVIAEPKSFLGQ